MSEPITFEIVLKSVISIVIQVLVVAIKAMWLGSLMRVTGYAWGYPITFPQGFTASYLIVSLVDSAASAIKTRFELEKVE